MKRRLRRKDPVPTPYVAEQIALFAMRVRPDRYLAALRRRCAHLGGKTASIRARVLRDIATLDREGFAG